MQLVSSKLTICLMFKCVYHIQMQTNSIQSWSILLPSSSTTEFIIKMMREKQLTVFFSFISFKISQLLKLQVNGLRVYDLKIKNINAWKDSCCYYLSINVSIITYLQPMLSVPSFNWILLQSTVFLRSFVSKSLSPSLFVFVLFGRRRRLKILTFVSLLPSDHETTLKHTILTLIIIVHFIPSPLPFSSLHCLWVNWWKSKIVFVEFWLAEAELLDRVDWIHKQNENTMKQCLLMCLFTVHTVHVFSFFPFFYSLFFPSVVYSNRRNLWPKALIFLMYILTHLQTIINQCRNGVSDNYSTKSKKKL